jgi:hypothetical protein
MQRYLSIWRARNFGTEALFELTLLWPLAYSAYLRAKESKIARALCGALIVLDQISHMTSSHRRTPSLHLADLLVSNVGCQTVCVRLGRSSVEDATAKDATSSPAPGKPRPPTVGLSVRSCWLSVGLGMLLRVCPRPGKALEFALPPKAAALCISPALRSGPISPAAPPNGGNSSILVVWGCAPPESCPTPPWPPNR